MYIYIHYIDIDTSRMQSPHRLPAQESLTLGYEFDHDLHLGPVIWAGFQRKISKSYVILGK